MKIAVVKKKKKSKCNTSNSKKEIEQSREHCGYMQCHSGASAPY